MAKKDGPGDVSIGKFDILATYTYAKALLDGLDDDEARERGMVAAVMGAKARSGHGGGTQDDHKARQGRRREEEKDDDHRRVVRPSGRRQDGRVLRQVLPADHEEAREGRPLVRRGEEAREDPDDLGGEDHRASSSRSGPPQHFERSRNADPHGPGSTSHRDPCEGRADCDDRRPMRSCPRQPGRVMTGPNPTPTGPGAPPRSRPGRRGRRAGTDARRYAGSGPGPGRSPPGPPATT